MHRSTKNKARDWTTPTSPRVFKVDSKYESTWQINMIQMFKRNTLHPTGRAVKCSGTREAASSSSQLEKLIIQGWRPINVNGLEEQGKKNRQKSAELLFYIYIKKVNHLLSILQTGLYNVKQLT